MTPTDAAVMRILVTRLRFLGDVVLSTPLLARLRQAFPDASLEYLTFEQYAPVLAAHPCVDRVHELPRNAGLGATVSMARRLASPRVDWWFDLFGSPRSALIALLARPRHSVGPSRGLRSRVFTHRRRGPEGPISAVDHHLDALEPLLDPSESPPIRIHVTDSERQGAKQRFNLTQRGAPILLHPGSTWPSKAWPVAKWIDLADRLSRSRLGPVWMLSAPGEEGLSQAIVEASGMGVEGLPTMPLRELLALIAESRMYIGNDGGILHCACALQRPTIGLFGPTEREVWFPHEGRGPYRLLQEYVSCRPCHLHECWHRSCLEALPVGRVESTARELLKEVEASSLHG